MAYDITSYYPGSIADDDLIFAFRAPRDITVNTGIGLTDFAPDALVTADIQKNGVSAGSVTVATDGTVTCTFTAFDLDEGDRLEVIAPSSGNEGLGNLALTFLAEINPTPEDTELVYDMGGFFPGVIPAGVRVIGCLCARNNVSLSQGLGTVKNAPSSTRTFSVRKNGTEIGTAVVATSGLVTVTITTTVFNAGDLLEVVAPLPSGASLGDDLDLTLTDVAVNFQGQITVA